MPSTELDESISLKLNRVAAYKALAKAAERAAKAELEDITPALAEGVTRLDAGRISVSPAVTEYKVTDPQEYAEWLREHGRGELTAERTIVEPLSVALDPAFIATIAETSGFGTPDGVELRARDRRVTVYPDKDLLARLAGGAPAVARQLEAA